MSISTRTEDAELDDLSYGDKGPPPEEMSGGVHYPSTDGEEMGENDWHYFALSILYGMLRERYEGQDAYVAADMMLYYEQGNPKAVRAPDCMVVLRVKPHRRYSWMTWEEGAIPAVVFELASPNTHKDDLGVKRRVYERIGIPEYVLFDPIGTCMGEPRLRGFRLKDGEYAEIEPVEEDGIVSEQLGVMIFPEGEILRMVDMQTRRFLRTPEETTHLLHRDRRRFRELRRWAKATKRRALRALAKQRQSLIDQRLKAEAETARAEAETARADAERQKAEAETARADAERLQAEAERLKAEVERQKADRLAAEVERLRALLGMKADDQVSSE